MRKLAILLFSFTVIATLSGCVHHSVKYREVHHAHIPHETIIIKSTPYYRADYHVNHHVNKTVVVTDRVHHIQPKYEKHQHQKRYEKPRNKVVVKEVKHIKHSPNGKEVRSRKVYKEEKHYYTDSQISRRAKPEPVKRHIKNQKESPKTVKNQHSKEYQQGGRKVVKKKVYKEQRDHSKYNQETYKNEHKYRVARDQRGYY